MYSVRRHRIGKPSRPSQGVAGPSDGADEALFSGSIYLLPEVADVDVYQICGEPTILVPHAREQQIAREHPSGVADHELEQLVLAEGELDLPAPSPHLLGGCVDFEVRHAEYLITLRPPEQRPDAGQKLLYVEGLGQVIVGTVVEAVDLIQRAVAGCQHDHRDPATCLAYPPQDPDPVQSG